MAKELNIAVGITGQTVVATPYLLAVAQTPISMTEYGMTGVYWGDMSGSPGVYEVIFSIGGITKGSGEISWDGTTEVTGANVTHVNGILVSGSGTLLNPWGPA